MTEVQFRPAPIPTVSQRVIELQAIGLPGARARYRGRELNFHVSLAPGAFGRLYQCVLKVMPDGQRPDMIVVEPDLTVLTGGKKIPHTYTYSGKGTRLCLWWPNDRDWVPQMSLAETYIPWTAEWLYYFELWCKTGEWAGGGEHPVKKVKRWARSAAVSIT